MHSVSPLFICPVRLCTSPYRGGASKGALYDIDQQCSRKTSVWVYVRIGVNSQQEIPCVRQTKGICWKLNIELICVNKDGACKQVGPLHCQEAMPCGNRCYLTTFYNTLPSFRPQEVAGKLHKSVVRNSVGIQPVLACRL